MNFLISAIFFTVCNTFDGSFGKLPSGDKYGPSVSVVIWFMFAISASIWKCWLLTMFVGIENM